MRILSDKELVAQAGETCICDIESYPNYFLICFYFPHLEAGVYFEGTNFNRKKLRWVLQNLTIVTFNGKSYDNPIMLYALLTEGVTESDLFNMTTRLIVGGLRSYELYNAIGIMHIEAVGMSDVDIIELVPLRPSLKLVAGRVHAPYMQDLPYAVGKHLEPHEMVEVLKYCWNDCINTQHARIQLKKALKLRTEMGKLYGVDLRSKSDAQIAEVVISRELMWRHGIVAKVPKVPVGHQFKYKIPDYIKYEHAEMNEALEIVRATTFTVGEDKKVQMPKELKKLSVTLNGSKYRMGNGGLHSSEQRVTHEEDDEYMLVDRDVASYYPAIIINSRLYPEHLGPSFLDIYKGIVDKRLVAKAAGDKSTADSLKITINGSFGKLGSPYSFLYSPELMIQTTLTGQLALLMLIDMLESAGFDCVSANTDGVVTKIKKDRKDEFDRIVGDWERRTNFVTEETRYSKLCSRDVNNYIAIKPDGTYKTKGCYSASISGEGEDESFTLGKNPTGQIINEAVCEYLVNGTSLEHTITTCTDIRRFLYVRRVKGGCVDHEQTKLGKVVRWYFGLGAFFPLYDATSGNKVAGSDGSIPHMDLSGDFPKDIDYNSYLREAKRILNFDFKKPEQLTFEL